MTTTLRRCLIACCALGVGLPGVAVGVSSGAVGDDRSGAARSSMGRVPSSGGVLLVTFEGQPAAQVVSRRLAGLGVVRESVPEVGVWELAPVDRATVRSRALQREGVVRAEWALERRLAGLPARTPAINPLPQLVLPEPSDPYYLDAGNGQWSMRLGNWTPGLTARNRPVIAILDSGLDTTHEEWRTPGLVVSPYSTVRNIPDARDWSTSGHGTHVAGIAAAPMNGVGIVGVAPANTDPTMPGARILPVQIATAEGTSSDATMMRGIRWAVGHGAKVINISSGGEGYNQAFQDTVNWAYKRGALIVASAGNEGQLNNPVNFPAGYDHVIGVGAQCDGTVDPPDCPVAFGRATFSNFNYTVDVLAPGVNILSTVPTGVSKNILTPGYGYIEGTSMSAPYVAGVAALVFASHPGASPFQVTRILESTASRAAAGLGRTGASGWGAVNPAAAVNAVAPVNDLSEVNDDVRYLPMSTAISLRNPRVRTLTGWADYNDDQFDTYGVLLAKGKRVRVTLNAPKGRLGAVAYRPGSTVSPRIMTDRQILLRELGETPRTTPGRRGFVFTAKETGRHFIWVVALSGGGDYSLKLERLN